MNRSARSSSKLLFAVLSSGALGPGVGLLGCDDDASADHATADLPDAAFDGSADADVANGTDADVANGTDANAADLPMADRPGSDGAAAAGNAPTLTAIMADYPTWMKRTAAPVPIASEIFALCRAPTAAEQQFVGSVHGNNRALLDWLNPAAATGIAAGGLAPFAVGAAIVKEKLVGASTGGFTLAARGFMVKRAPGFDPAAGDWEFAYWEPGSGIVAGRAQTAACIACHANTRATDWVFVDEAWRRP